MTTFAYSARHRQRGVALITALLVVAIAGILAVELVWQTNLDLKRTEGLLGWEQARQLGYGAEAFAAAKMQEQFDETGNEPYTRDLDKQFCLDGLAVVLAKEDIIPEGGWAGRACDLQGRFNLNNLVLVTGKKDELVVKQFRRLLNAVSIFDKNIDIAPPDIDVIVDSVVDWIDPDTTAEFNGAEDDYYTGLTPPYQAANWWFTSTSELLAVKGVTPEIYEALRPYVAALPVPVGGTYTTINVNTASEPVLMSLGDDITLANAQEWIKFSESSDGPFKDTTQFTNFVDAGHAAISGFHHELPWAAEHHFYWHNPTGYVQSPRAGWPERASAAADFRFHRSRRL